VEGSGTTLVCLRVPLVLLTTTTSLPPPTLPSFPARSLPFDEYAVWTENIEYVRKALDLPGSVRVFMSDDAALAPGSESAKTLDPMGKVKEVVPLEPDVHPYVPAA
jgi:hypothetical protein